jgi:hypothetical protein
VPDGHLFVELLKQSHYVSAAQFSRQHQQTAIHWLPGVGQIEAAGLQSNEIFGDISPDKLQRLFSKRNIGRNIVDQDPESGVIRIRSINLSEARLSGDDARVQVVISRLGSFLNAGSDLARYWRAIRATIVRTAEKGVETERLFDLYCDACEVVGSFAIDTVGRWQVSVKDWSDSANDLRGAAAKVNVQLDLPNDISDFVRDEWIFNASSYWRDWLTFQ